MSKFIDMTGWVMKEHDVPDSRLTVVGRSEDYISPNGYREIRWDCTCECGTQHVIVCTDTGRVKAALHMGNGKFDTYMKVLYWMDMPEAPKMEMAEVIEEPVKKKRGRPKKEK